MATPGSSSNRAHPIVPLEELFSDVQADAIYKEIRTVLGKYRRTLQFDRRHLLEQFTGGPWPGRTPVPVTASRSPPTSAAPAHSTGRSPTSPKPTRQNERDYAALQAAVKDGRAETATEI